MQKNNTIEFWRFMFTITICLLHFIITYFSSKFYYFNGGYIAVEFFFILSGFLLMSSFENRKVKVRLLKYIYTRIIKLYPHYIFSFIIIFIYTAIDRKETFIGILKLGLTSI